MPTREAACIRLRPSSTSISIPSIVSLGIGNSVKRESGKYYLTGGALASYAWNMEDLQPYKPICGVRAMCLPMKENDSIRCRKSARPRHLYREGGGHVL